MAERQTFSPFWHRVRTMKPRLRPHVSITRQRYRARIWHVVHDPTSNQFYRLNPIAHELVGLLDGTREVEEAWKITLAKFGDGAPTQNEVIQLISQLYSSNLLAADTSPETEQLLRRGRERIGQKVKQQAIGIMYFRIRVFNPDAILSFLEPIFRPIINPICFFLWLAFLIWGVISLLPYWSTLQGGFEGSIAPSNWALLIVVFIVAKAIHEAGHGLICKRFGGQVPEFGVMLLVLFPAPYVDASACWSFASKWQRMAVGAGGMIFELFIATCAAFVWIHTVETNQDGLLRQLAYNTMLTASISTILFNANPLMRFDGYYMLSDMLEVPNLAGRANKMLKYLFQKYVYRLRNPTPPTSLPGERAILIAYGIAALAYRVFLFFSITLYVMGKMFALGLILAVWTAGAWFVLPIGSFIHWHASNSQLAEHRLRHVVVSAGMIATVIVLIGFIPMPDHRRAVGVVESLSRSGVFLKSDGFVAEAHVHPGARVSAGDPLVTLVNADLLALRDSVLTQLAELQMRESEAIRLNEPAAAQVAGERAVVAGEQLEKLTVDIENLVIRAPHAGVVVGPDPHTMLGAYKRRGEPLVEVVDVDDVRINATLRQQYAAWVYDLPRDAYSVMIRPMADIDTFITGGAVDPSEAAQRVLPHASLGYAGGGSIEIDPSDQQGRVAKRERFLVRITPEPQDDESAMLTSMVGQRVRVRFTLPSKPLLTQWTDRLSKTIQGRVKL